MVLFEVWHIANPPEVQTQPIKVRERRSRRGFGGQQERAIDGTVDGYAYFRLDSGSFSWQFDYAELHHPGRRSQPSSTFKDTRIGMCLRKYTI